MPELSFMGDSAITCCRTCNKLFVVSGRDGVRGSSDAVIANLRRHIALSPRCKAAETEAESRWKASETTTRERFAANAWNPPLPPPVFIDVDVRYRIAVAAESFPGATPNCMEIANSIGAWQIEDEATAADILRAEVAA